MPTFSPPTYGAHERGDHDSDEPEDRLLRYYAPHPAGFIVYRDADGYHEATGPVSGGNVHRVFDNGVLVSETEFEGLLDAEEVYYGGSVNQITAQQAEDLTVAGYGDYINLDPVEVTWTQEQADRFSTKYLLTADGSHATPDHPTAQSDYGIVQLSAGTTPDATNLREFFLHEDTEGWTDTHVVCEGIDPPLFDTDVDGVGDYDILPQGGVCLRAQFDQATGKNTGITLNNGTFLGLAILNVGAWRAFPDGTTFQNRQFSWPLFESLPLPYGFEAFLEGNIIRVRIFPAGREPNVTPWDHVLYSRTLNLDTDCGSTATVPTPTGPGSNGIISAHLGTDSRSAVRLRRIHYERLD